MKPHSPTFCKLPWTNLNTTPQGNCKLCCNIVDDRLITDWSDVPRTMDWSVDDLEAIWNGSYMQDVRSRMLSGQEVADCEGCYAAERLGNTSSRQATNDDDFYVIKGTPGVVATELPMSLELRLTNRCNLACHSCWGGSSSRVFDLRQQALALNDDSDLVMPAWLRNQWRGESNILSRKDKWYGITEDYVTQQKSLDNFSKLAKTLRRLYITGGEPTMDRTIHLYLDRMVDADNWGCHVSWTTNCTLWNEPLMQRLGFFQNNELQLSIDAFGVANEYIRRPTSWEAVAENVGRYMVDTRVKDLRIFTVVSALNAAVLPELVTWLRELADRSNRKAIWWPIMLRFPDYQDALLLRSSRRNGMADELESMLSQDETNLVYKDGLRNVINLLRQGDHPQRERFSSQLREYLDYSDRLDGKAGMATLGWHAALPHLEID